MSLDVRTALGRMKMLLRTGEHADVHFLVGDGDSAERFSAHKLILSTASDVFKAMFRYDGANESDDGKTDSGKQVEIPDVEPGAFKAMLNFVYWDDLSEQNGDNTISLLYAAKKYHLPELVRKCVAFPVSELPDVFMALEQARFFEEEAFAGRCLAYIDKHADRLFHSSGFLQIGQKLLSEILGRDQLMISFEISVWNAALRWANEWCLRNNLECSAYNRRVALGPALFKIRFTFIPHDKITTEIVPTNVLSRDELLSVLLYHSHPKHTVHAEYPLPFSIRKRTLQEDTSKTITLRIKKFSEFARENKRILSDAVIIKGMPWQISARPYESSEKRFLSFFIRCDAEEEEEEDSSDWHFVCSAIFRIFARVENGDPLIARFDDKLFDAGSKSRGWNEFVSFEKLMGKGSEWYNKSDTVTLGVHLTVG